MEVGGDELQNFTNSAHILVVTFGGRHYNLRVHYVLGTVRV